MNEFQENNYSLVKTILWMLFLTLGLQAIIGGFIGLGVGGSGTQVENIELVFSHPDLLASIAIIAAILSIPLIMFIIKATKEEKQSFPYKLLAIKPIKISTLLKVLVAGVSYYVITSLLGGALDIENPNFMMEIKSQTNCSGRVILAT